MLSLGFVNHPHRDFEPRTATGSLIALAPGQVWSGDPLPGRDLVLVVNSGEVWVTQAGDRIDHIIHTGEHLRLAPGGRIVIQATDHSLVRIDGPEAARPTAA